MLRKIKNGFICFFCFIWISFIWLIGAASQEEGGAELNGFLAFILWIVSIFVMIKVKPIVSAVGSTILLIAIRIHKYGFNVDMEEISDELIKPIGIVLILFILWKLSMGTSDGKEDERGRGSGSILTGYKRNSKEDDYVENDYAGNYYDSYHEEPKPDRGLKSGSDDYWRYKERAEYIYRSKGNAKTYDDRKYWTDRGLDMADMLIGKYGPDDPVASYLIEQFYLDRKD